MLVAFNRRVKRAFALALLALAVAPQVPGQRRTGIIRRVEFPLGRTSIVITGDVPLGKRDTYIFRARKGQLISGDVIWQGKRVSPADDQGLSGLIFVEPDGTSHTDPQDFYFAAKATGDYRVVVRPPYKMTGYKYRFELAIGKVSTKEERLL